MVIPAAIASAGRGIASAFGKAKGAVGGAWSGAPGAMGKVDLAQSAVTGMRAGEMVRNPLIGGPAAFFGGAFLKDVAYDPLVKAFDDRLDPFEMSLRDAKIAHEQNQSALYRQMEIENLQRDAMQASMRLAALDPHLYNEVMAGRSLPKDAVVFGGQPRQDLMQELALAMAQGQFKQQSAQDELMQELGV